MERSRKKRVLIVDDHPMIRERLSELIRTDSGLEVCGAAEDAGTAMEMVRETQPDIALVDLNLKDSNGLELMKNVQAQYPEILVLIISMHDEQLFGERAIRAGASGYINKQKAIREVLTAIHKILSGEVYLSQSLAEKLLSQAAAGGCRASSPAVCLSEREQEIFRLIGIGNTTREIAERLHLEIPTVDTYRSRIKEKLGLLDATELLKRAIEWVRTSDFS